MLSYIRDIPSPINTIYLNKLNEILSEFTIPVNFMKFDSFDKGDIDYLILGMEGSEFTVFQSLISRPHIISLHNYFANDYKYTFPYFDYIENWCVKNNYYIIFGIPNILLVNKKSIENETLVLN